VEIFKTRSPSTAEESETREYHSYLYEVFTKPVCEAPGPEMLCKPWWLHSLGVVPHLPSIVLSELSECRAVTPRQDAAKDGRKMIYTPSALPEVGTWLAQGQGSRCRFICMVCLLFAEHRPCFSPSWYSVPSRLVGKDMDC